MKGLCITGGLVVLLAGSWIIQRPVLQAIGRWLDVSTDPVGSDFVMVLTGDHHNRPFVVGAVRKSGCAAHVLVPHLQERPTPSPWPDEHEVICEVLRWQGVADHDVTVLEPAVHNTRDEAEALATFLEDHPDATVAVVTSHYHTRRARHAFHQVLGDRAAHVFFYGAPTDGFDLKNWWRTEIGFATVLTEYLKLAAYLARDPVVMCVAAGVVLLGAGMYRGWKHRRRIVMAASPQDLSELSAVP